MNAKPKVRFLCPIWGAPYIRRFLALSLPSFLAPGNLPALAELCDLEICILTVSTDEPVFSESPALAKLKSIAPFKFISIDDLVLDQHHGVTLTLAYLRGVTDLGEQMTRQFVLFLNADIVLADGSFRGAARKILEGHPVILANSVRATSELVEPQLKALIDLSQTLAVPPRELMRMALAAMHPLQVAKVVNSDLCYSIHANQFYWQADATTLVSRHFLMFMLCLKPERVVTEVGSFCDYSFVPEFCPTSPAIAMTDSDEFCALELQNADHESSYLRIGRPDPTELAESLSRWTTEDHRRNALDHTIVFHAGDLPKNLEAVNAEARRYIEHLISLMPAPQPYRGHPYWVGSYYNWQLRASQLKRMSVPEDPFARPAAAADAGSAFSHVNGVKRPLRAPAWGFARRKIGRVLSLPSALVSGGRAVVHRSMKKGVVSAKGNAPFVPIWHPAWLDYRPVREALGGATPTIYVSSAVSTFRHLVEQRPIAFQEALSMSPPPRIGDSSRRHIALVEPLERELPQLRRLLDHLAVVLGPDAKIILFYRPTLSDDTPVDAAVDLLQALGGAALQQLQKLDVAFAGGSKKLQLEQRLKAARLRLQAGGTAAALGALQLIPLLARVSKVNWLGSELQDSRVNVFPCTSLTLTYRT